MLEVIPLGIAAAITPGLIALQIIVVSGPKWGRRALAVFVANALAFAIVGALLLLGLAQLPDAGTGRHDLAYPTIRLIAAAILFLTAVFFVIPHPRLLAKSQAALKGVEGKAKPWEFAVLAFYFSITDVSSFAVMAPALHDVTVSSADLIVRVFFVALFFVLALMATWTPPVIRVLLRSRAERVLSPVYSFVMDRQFQILAVMCAVFGIYLLATGLAAL
jgi:hypothetical protein